MKIERWPIVVSLLCGVLYWIIDSFLDATYYIEGTFWQLAVTDVPSHEVYVRLTLVGLLLILGSAMSFFLRRLRLHRDALQESRERLITTLHSIGDAVIATDSSGRVDFLNPVAVELTGWNIDEALGQPCDKVFNIISEETNQPAVNPVERVLREGRVVGLANHTALIRRDGTRVPIDDSGAPIRDAKGNVAGAVLVFHDISERKAAEEKIEHLNSVLLAIRNVNQLITHVDDREELVRRACDLLIETRGYHAAWIGLLDRNGNPPVVYGAGVESEPIERLLSEIRDDRIPSCWRRAQRSEDPVTVTDPAAECPGCCMASCFEDSGSMTLRLTHAEDFYGYLSVTMPLKHTNDPDELALFEEVAGDIAFALHSIELARRHEQAGERLRLSVENMLEGWVMLQAVDAGDGRPSDFRFIQINPAAEKMLQLVAEQQRGRLASEVFPRASKTGLLDSLVEVMREGKPFRIDGYEMRVGDRRLYIDLAGFRIDDRHLGCTFRDVTDRIEFEQRLQAERDRAQNYLDVVRVMVVALDHEGRVSLVNEKACELLEAPESDIIGRSWFDDFIPPEQVADVRDVFNKLMSGEVSITEFFENEICTAKGNRRLIAWHNTLLRDDSGDIIGTLSAGDDVTERRAMRAALAESEKRYRGLFEGSRDGIVMIDPEGRFVECNQAYADMVGYSIEELRELDFLQITPEKWHEWEWNEIVQKQLLGRGYTDLYEKEYRRKDGSVFPVELRSYRLDDEQGNPVALWGVARDISARKKVLDSLRESEEKFSKAFHTSPYVVVITRAEDGKFIDVNDAFTTVTGYTPDEALADSAIGLNLWVHQEDRDRVLEDLRQGRPVTGREYEFRRKDGEIIIGLYSAHVISLQGEPCILSSVSDITERIQAQKSLAESEARLRTLYSSVQAGVVLQAADGRIIHANDVACEILRMNRDEVTGRTSTDEAWNMVLEDGTPVRGEEHPAMVTLRTGEPMHHAVRGLYADDPSAMRWILINTEPLADPATGEVGEVMSTFSDITELKQTQAALATERKRLDITLHSIGDGVITTDAAGKITMINKVAEELTGFDEQAAIGRPLDSVFKIINEDSRETVESPVHKVMRTGRIVGLANSTLLVSRDGQERVIADSGAPIRDENGQITGVVLVFRDVTEKRRMQDFAVRAQRLETAGRIAGQVAHDFNNLLAPLMAYPPFIREAVPDNAEVADYIDKIQRAAEQMADINQQLLTLGRRGHYAIETLNLNDIVRQVIKQTQPSPETLVLDISLASDLMPIRGGGSQLFRGIVNLISNAMDAMQGVGRLTVRTENFYLDESAGRYGHIPRGEYIKLTVADTGSGIPHVILNKIFEPFFTTKTSDRRRGSGLGLSVVHSVIEDHGGYIDFDSTMGEGTEFYVYLPVSRESLLSDTQSDQITGGSELILVVDDDWTQRDVTVTLLEKMGYRATSAESGEQALEVLKDRPCDLVILDMIMPDGIDGTETFEQIRKLYPDQKAIIVSGYAENDRVRQALDLGCGAFVRKPITLKSIAQAVRRELDRAPTDTASPERRGDRDS